MPNTNLLTMVNVKLGGKIPQLNMPYAVSCRPDAPCYKECYCNKGNMKYSNVRKSHMEKLNLYKENPKKFFEKVDAEMQFVQYKYFRYHASGDIVDERYLDLMCWLARRHKETKFLCFTKKYELVNNYLNNHRKPANLTIVLSNWGEWRVENPHNLPMSYVDFGKGTEDIPEASFKCQGRCANCNNQHCWNMKKGDTVCFHKH